MADMHRNQPVPTTGALAVNSTTPAGQIFPSLVRAAGTYTSEELFNPNWKGVRLYLNRTVATGTVVFSIEGRDPVSDSWVAVPTAFTPSLTSAILTTLTIYPGLLLILGSATTSTEVNGFLPCSWRVKAVTSTDTTTWSVGAEYLL